MLGQTLFELIPTHFLLLEKKPAKAHHMLELIDFRKSYGSDFHLEIGSLNLEAGIHLILGENGSGKSTLLKAVAGIHPFEGEIVLSGVSISKDPLKYRKLIGFAEAEPLFPDFLSLEDLIQVVVKAKPSSPTQVEDLKETLKIGAFSQQAIGSYSSGMLKKSALLLAFIGDPKLIILDEAFTTLDVGTQHSLTKLVQRKSKEGTSFLLTSHQNEPITAFDLISTISLNQGRIIEHEGA